MNRLRRLSSVTMVTGAALLCSIPAMAQQADMKPSGLWLTTDYPAITERIGEDATLSLSLANSNEPPARVEFSVNGLPDGWKWELDGGGKPVKAAMVTPDENRSLQLKVSAPKDVKAGTYDFTVIGQTADGQSLKLPITMTLAAADPDKVTIEPKLPALRGTPRSNFDFDLTIKNDSAEDQTFNLLADAPAGFQTTFKEQYGSQELTSLPFKPGETKTVKLSVTPPRDISAGQYPVAAGASNDKVKAATKLLLDITGQPKVALAAPEGRLSGRAEAGKEETFDFTVSNSGSAPAANVALNASAPQGWKMEVDPKSIPELAPGSDQKFAVHMTPSDKAIAGDYMVTVSARGDGVSDSSDFRVTVTTSTMWGLAGLGVIGSAVIVLAFAVARYGRR
ncbi:COG1470 family protein [Rhizobium sp. PAMB 3174]